MRRALVYSFAELLIIRNRCKDICAHGEHTCGQQNHNRDLAAHRRSPVRTGAIKSENELAVTVTMAIINVRPTSSGTSRPRAARQASWPIPGVSVTTSTGIAAPRAILTLIPASAIKGAAIFGNTC